MSRRTLFVALLVVLAVSAAAAVFWHYASDAFRGAVEGWVADRRAEGMEADFSALVVQGSPLRLQTTLRDPVLARPVARAAGAGGQAWEWRGAEVVAAIRPWNRRRVELRFPGTHQITLPLGPANVTLFAEAGQAVGALDLDGTGWPVRGEFRFEDLDVLSEGGGSAVSLARLELSGVSHFAAGVSHETATFDLSVAGRHLDLPAQSRPPLGTHIAELECEASLMGAIPPGPMAQAMATWRDDGGTIEVHRLHLEWGPLAIEAGGTLALDSSLQPIGALSAIVRGFPETVDALVAGGMVTAEEGDKAKAVLGLLAKAPKGGGPPELTVAVTLQNGWVYVGPVALMRIAEWPWE